MCSVLRWAVDCDPGGEASLQHCFLQGENNKKENAGLTGTISGGGAAAVQEDMEAKFCWSDFNLEFI